MPPCLVIGDSLAVGVGRALPECQTLARVGVGSGGLARWVLPSADKVAVSLGANDPQGSATRANLQTLRARLGGRVVWLLPGLPPQAREAVRDVARAWGDQVIDTGPQAGPDHLHPQAGGYQTLAREVNQLWRDRK